MRLIQKFLFLTCMAVLSVASLSHAQVALQDNQPEPYSGCVMFNDKVYAHRGTITNDTEIADLASGTFDPQKWTELGSITTLSKEDLELCGVTITVYYLSGQNGIFTVASYEVMQLGEVITLLSDAIQELQQPTSASTSLDVKIVAIQEKLISEYGDTCCCYYAAGDTALPATWLDEPKNEWACINYSMFYTYRPLHCYGDPALAAAPASYSFSEKCASLHGYVE